MTAFWLYAGLPCPAALAFILVPQLHLLRRRVDIHHNHLNVGIYRERVRELAMHHDAGTLDATQLEVGRVEVARELLADARFAEHATGTPLGRAVPLVAALSTPLLAVVLYPHWGSLNQLMVARRHSGQSAQSIAKVTTRLEALLAATPESAEGWSLRARAYMAQERTSDAARAFERAATLSGRTAELLGHWAEASYVAGGRQWTPQLQAPTDEALARLSLNLAGIAAFRAGRYVEAATYWERLAATLPEGDPSHPAVDDDVTRARESAKASATKGAPL